MYTPSKKHGPLGLKARHILVLASVLFVALLFAILRAPWCDEVAYVDPGATLALTGTFSSTAWVSSSPLDNWGSSTPAMPLMFAAWFKAFGFGQIQARALFCLLHLVGTLLLVAWLRRYYGLSAWGTVVVVAALWIFPSTANAIYQCRLEAVAVLFFAWFLWYAFNPSNGEEYRLLPAFFLGVATALTGLHFCGFYALAAIAVALASFGRRTILQGLSLGLGMAVALLVIFGFYTKTGAWEQFVSARAAHYGRDLPWVLRGPDQWLSARDLILAMALAAASALIVYVRNSRLSVASLAPWVLALLSCALIPPVINIIGIYYANYAWMVALPVLVFFVRGFGQLFGWHRQAIAAIFAVLALGLGAKRAFQVFDFNRDLNLRSQVAAEFSKLASPGLAVAADWPFYYELMGRRFEVYLRVTKEEGEVLGYKQSDYLPKKLENQIRFIVARAKVAESMTQGLGGEWRLLAVFDGALEGGDYRIYVRK